MNQQHTQTEQRGLVPARHQLMFSRQYTDDRAQRQAGLLILAILLGGILAWSLTAPIADGIHATATVTITAEREIVTHPHGGTVGELLVRSGDIVDLGQVLLKLDRTDTEEALERIGRERSETLALQSRLLAGADTDTVAPHQRETALLAAQLAGLEQQLDAQTRLRDLYASERTTLAPAQAATAEQQRSLRDIDQRLARQDALIAELETRIATARLERLAIETEAQRHRQDAQQLSEAALAGAAQKLERLDRQHQALTAALQAKTMVAPLAGRVALAPAIGPGEPIAAGDPVLSIQPHAGGLVVTASIRTAAGFPVRPGHRARIRLIADDTGKRLRLAGQVSQVSPTTDAGGRMVTIHVPATGDYRATALAGGYPAEIFFDHGERTLARRLLDRLEHR
jgi:multidrug resistance efflux pump